jgi:signal transduction histidine kinase
MTLSWPATFRTRLTLHWTLVFGVLLAAANTAIYVAVRMYAYADLDAKVRTLAATETVSSTDGPIGLHVHELPVRELGLVDFTEKFVQIFDAGGRLVAASSFPGMGRSFVDPVVVQAGLAGEAPLIDLDVDGRYVRAVALKASRDDRRYTVIVGLVADDIEAGLSKLAWLLLCVWSAGVAATGFAGFALASTALRPVERITRRAAAIARGEFNTTLDPPMVEDEIGRMTRLLNEVLERLQLAVNANRRFAADASHELRGPITAMTGEIDVALRHPRAAEEYRETLSLVRQRLSALTSLTEDLMLLVRSQETNALVERREVDLDPLIAGSIGRTRELAARRGVAVTVEPAPPLILYGEARLLARVLDNVLENAIRYNTDAGRVSIAASLEDGGDPAQPTHVVLQCRDSGPGIPPADWERIFERFFRLDQSRARHTGGKGLGLAICREVLRLFGGTIRVRSSSSDGTVIELRMPGALGVNRRRHQSVA